MWDLHKLYSSDETLAWVRQGCTTAGIGCLDCKKPLIEKISAEAAVMRERSEPYRNNPARVREILAAGAVRANAAAEATLDVVRRAMHLVPEA